VRRPHGSYPQVSMSPQVKLTSRGLVIVTAGVAGSGRCTLGTNTRRRGRRARWWHGGRQVAVPTDAPVTKRGPRQPPSRTPAGRVNRVDRFSTIPRRSFAASQEAPSSTSQKWRESRTAALSGGLQKRPSCGRLLNYVHVPKSVPSRNLSLCDAGQRRARCHDDV
jgi:hypothetical protein